MKKLLSLLLISMMLVEVLTAAVVGETYTDTSLPFTDVRSDQWFYSAVKEVYAEGVMKGVSETEFAPAKSLTRAETVTLLSRTAYRNVSGLGEKLTFKDTNKAAWYADYVGWAAQSGVVNGYDDGTFKPNSPVTRQELATLIVRFLSYMEVEPAYSPKIAKFKDESSIAGWAKESTEAMRKMGLMNGDENGRFNPKSTATRAEMAALTSRILPGIFKLPVVSEGTSDFKIVVSGSDTAAQAAAERISEQLAYETGVMLETVSDESTPAAHEIVLGKTNRATLDTDGLGENGYVIRLEGEKIFVDGETGDGIYRGAVSLIRNSVTDGNMTVTNKTEERVAAGYPVKKLTVNGNDISVYSVAVIGETSPATEKAVSEIKKYIKKACGAELSDAPAGGSGYAIILDTSSPTDEESFTVRSEENSVRISGNKLRGILYGAYDFLETCVGWRFLTEDVDFIRDSERTDVSDVDYGKHPYFDERTLLIQCYSGGDIVMKRGLGVIGRAGVNYEYGGYTYTGASCHTLGPLSETGGDIDPNPCLTDEKVYETTLKNVMELIESNPGTRLVSVSVNDTSAHCECERCLAVEAEEGSPAGTMLRFVNRIADEVAKTHPEVKIHTFAYLHTQPAPKITKPRENVLVELCSIYACFGHGLFEDKCENNKQFAKDIGDWSAICKNLLIWDYTVDFAFYTHLFTNIRYEVLAGNLKGFCENNVRGVMEQGEYNGRGTCFTELRCYLMSKTMWDPFVTKEEYYGWMDEFLEGYYGDGWQKIRKCIDTTVDRKSIQCIGIYENPMSSIPVSKKELINLVALSTEAKYLADSAKKYEHSDIVNILYQTAHANLLELISGDDPLKIAESNDILRRMRKYGLRFSENYGILPEGEVTLAPCKWKELM